MKDEVSLHRPIPQHRRSHGDAKHPVVGGSAKWPRCLVTRVERRARGVVVVGNSDAIKRTEIDVATNRTDRMGDRMGNAHCGLLVVEGTRAYRNIIGCSWRRRLGF